LIILVIFLLFGGGYGYRTGYFGPGYGSPLMLVLVIIVVLLLLGAFGGPRMGWW
jgi:hypothetical protein